MMPTIDHRISLQSINFSIKNHMQQNKVIYAFGLGVAVGVMLRGRQSIHLSVNTHAY